MLTAFLRSARTDAVERAVLVRAALAEDLQASDFAHPGAERSSRLAQLFAALPPGSLYAPDGRVTFSTAVDSRTTMLAAEAAVRTGRPATREGDDATGAKILAVAVPVNGRGALVVSTPFAELQRAAMHRTIRVSAALELLLIALGAVFLRPIRRAIRNTRSQVRAAESDALRDTLTGLPNRRLLEDRMAQALAQAQRDGANAAVMLIDLDRFKEINDTVGHAAGDAVLRELAGRLATVTRDSDTVARLGGDEFAVVLRDGTRTGVHETALRLQHAIELPVEHDGMLLSVGASIGVAIYPEHGKSAAVLQRHADAAMYQAKRAGVGHLVFDTGTAANDEEKMTLTTELPAALERREIVLHYQPTVAVATGEIAEVEALLRWHHPTRGLLTADRFVPLADRAGVRAQLYEFALAEAVRQAGLWRQAGLTISVAVNLDARTLLDRDLPARLERLLDGHGVEAEQIQAEIAQSALEHDPQRVSRIATELSTLGVVLVIDEFGADHSSLHMLNCLPIEKLKIDRALLARALDSGREEIVFGGIVELAHKLGLSVVAAGVEDEAALELAREADVDYVQGYHLGAPVDHFAVERLYARNERAAA